LAGEPWAIHELLDRLLGKPSVQIDLQTDLETIRKYDEREAAEARRIARFLLENPPGSVVLRGIAPNRPLS
jgi:hypothetical protein